MCNYKYCQIHVIQVSVEMTLKYILVYYKCLSEHSVVHFNNSSKTIDVIMKLYSLVYS